MKIVFRADASVEIGSGHVMRCLTLADQLRADGAEVIFICRDLPGSFFELLQTRGYSVARLPFSEGCKVSQQVDAEETIRVLEQIVDEVLDWLVVDHYGLDKMWESPLRPFASKIMVIDDLANRQHDCDLLLDQNYYHDLEDRYNGLVPEHCITLLGPAYVLLRPEFAEARKKLRKRDGTVRRILVFFGGSDPDKFTHNAITALHSLGRPDIAVDIVVGASNPHREEISSMCRERPSMTYHCQISNMAELIDNADLCIGAGGATTWERCILGLPTITLVFAENQLATTRDLDNYGAVQFLGWAHSLSSEKLADAVSTALHDQEKLIELSRKSLALMRDWQGADYVAKAVIKLTDKEL